MRRRNWLRTAVCALAVCGAATLAGAGDYDVKVVDLNQAGVVPGTVAENESVYVTNTNAGNITATVTGDLNANGRFYVGLTGTDSTGGYTIADGKVTLNVTGDMHVNGRTWIGKWDMSSGSNTFYLQYFPEFGEYRAPPAPSDSSPHTNDVAVNVGGNLIVDSNDAVYMAADYGKSTTVTVGGDTILRSGGNHFVAYNSGTLTLTTRTFQLDGGEIEVIGSSGSMSAAAIDKCSIITTATSGNAVHLTNHADMTIMRGALFDQSAGGDFLVENGSELKGGSGGGRILLANGHALRVAKGATYNTNLGSIKVDGSVAIDGTLKFGFNANQAYMGTNNAFTSLTGTDVSLGESATFALTDAFVTKARADYTSADANAVVVEGTASLDYLADASWTSGEKALVENLYGKFVFDRNGNQIKFMRLDDSHLAGTDSARAYARTNVEKVFAAGGVDRRMLGSGYSDAVLRLVNDSKGLGIAGLASAGEDGSEAGKLHTAIANAVAMGYGSEFTTSAYGSTTPGTSGTLDSGFLSGFASMRSGHRGAAANAISMGVAGQAFNAVQGRLAANRAAFAQARERVGSDDALAAMALNANCANRVWVGGLGMWEDADTRKGIAGYKYDSYGFIGGYDRFFGPISVGGAFGYTSGDYEDKAASGHDSQIDNYVLSLYGTYTHTSGLFASLAGGFTHSDNDLNEYDGTNWAAEAFKTNTWNVGARFGYEWKPTCNLTLTPSAGISYTHAKNSGHDADYNGVGLFRYDSASNHVITLPVELGAAYDIAAGSGVVTLSGVAGYSYNFNDDGLETTVGMNGTGLGSFRASGREYGKHTYNLGGGVKYSRGDFDIGVRYDYVGKSKYDAHRVSGVLGLNF